MKRYIKSNNYKRYSDPIAPSKRRYWYFTTHGIGPGTIPSDLHVLETKDGQNEKGTWGTFVCLDGILNTSELQEYDLKELSPDNVMANTKTNELYGRFIAYGYYGTNYSGLADSFESSDYEYIKDKVHAMLSNGEYVEVEDTLTGASYRIDPDTYFEDFEGEFNVTREMQDFQDQIINSSRKISKSKINASLENDTELAVQLVDIVNEFDHYEYEDNSEGFVYDVIDMADKLDDKGFRDDIVTTLHYYIDEVKDSNYAGYDNEKEAKKFLDKCEDAINKLEHFQPIAASKRISKRKI